MPGTTNMLVGMGWFILGAGATYWSYSSALDTGGTYINFYGAYIIGGIQFVIGISQYLNYFVKSDEEKASLHAEISTTILLQVMLRVAAIDGKIDDNEIVMIRKIYQNTLGMEATTEEIKCQAEKMLNDGFDLYEFIDEKQSLINQEAIPIIFKAAYLVAAADGNIDKDEAEMIQKLASHLRMSNVDVNKYLDELKL